MLQIKLVAIGIWEVGMWYIDVCYMNVLEIYSPRKSADFVKFPNSDTDFQRSNIPKKPEGGEE